MLKTLKEKLDSEGFVFAKAQLTEDFREEVLNHDSPTERVVAQIKNCLELYGCPTEKLQIVFESFTKDQSNELHTHLAPADFQLLLWVPTESEFQGRDFLFGKKDDPVNSFKPDLGDLCFMKTNDLNFVHGVSPMESDTLVKTVIVSVNCTAQNGEHLTVTSDLKPV